MVVTLEPCNHVGRTGPCTQAIIDAGVSRVVYAVDDPHDPAAGGAARLRAAGVDVRSGLAAAEALKLNREWFNAVEARRPFVTLHIAQTLDSRIAAADGTSQWISSPESLADNHGLRRLIDAILVGTETVLVDNPRLTAREENGDESPSQPLRPSWVYGRFRRTPPCGGLTGSSSICRPATLPKLWSCSSPKASGTSWWKAAPAS
ncbi:riboflavin biosynthesis protein RibD [Arthrobacter sp. Hiyo8]|nr:riboflavin biosynthesis protein RibD [Arthrobacter sp. Hiyo8]